MHKLTIPFLNAVSESLDKIKDLIPKLADQLQIPVQELLYIETGDQGIIKNTNWRFALGNWACNLVHTKDKRELIVTFGPKGRIDTFSQWKVLDYIGRSKPPWPEYKELKKFLFPEHNENEKIPTLRDRARLLRFDGVNVNRDELKKILDLHEKTSLFIDELEANELIAHSYPELCQFVEKCTTTDDEGHPEIRFPDTITKKEHIDLDVCHLWIITAKGKDQIKKHRK